MYITLEVKMHQGKKKSYMALLKKINVFLSTDNNSLDY